MFGHGRIEVDVSMTTKQAKQHPIWQLGAVG
jgi:hypothetical protein